MACDQIEYCGNCPQYKKCVELAEKGRLSSCREHGKKG